MVTASRGRSLFARDDPLDDEGSDVELNRVVGKRDVIYKTKEVSVDSRPIEDSDDGGPLGLAWTNNGYDGGVGKSGV